MNPSVAQLLGGRAGRSLYLPSVQQPSLTCI